MITFQTLTQEEKFSRALAKVYLLLLRLAEEAEKATLDAHTNDEENVGGDTSVSKEISQLTLF